jgi:hypothetical protein
MTLELSSVCAVSLAAVLAGFAAGGVLSILQLTNALAVYWNLFAKLTGSSHRFENLDDVLGYLLEANPRLAELLVCPFCLGTWVCLPLALIALPGSFTWAWLVLLWPASIVVAVAVRLAFDGFETRDFMSRITKK